MLNTLRDTYLIATRDLRLAIRTPQFILVEVLIQPIIFVLLFAYVFGGAIHVTGMKYVDFLLPGILVQTAAFGSINTALALTEDLKNGLMDRFWSLPMARIAVVLGRIATDMILAAVGVTVMLIVGVLIGFRFHGSVAAAIGAIGVVLLFGFSFTWLAALLGVAFRKPEMVQATGFIAIFPLTFASSAFVPVATMPGWLQAFAQHTPMTATIDTVRHLVSGQSVGSELGLALAWIAVIIVLSGGAANWIYLRMAR
jgi:ABC-2 type transport system permease protein/oleandomycin transport system permease protein